MSLSALASSSLISGAFGLGTGLIGGYLNNYYNKKAQSAQNENQWNMWNATNDYNSPASVMQRLEEAGLNPNLVYGNGGASYQATMPTAPKRAPADFNLSFNPLTFQQMENMEAQQNLIDQQIKTEEERTSIAHNQGRIVRKDADIYEKTGVRPGDTVGKSLWRSVGDWFSDTALGRAYHKSVEEIAAKNEKRLKDRYNREKNPHALQI